MRALPVDRVAYLRARAVARAATIAALALGGYAVYRMLGYAASRDRLAMAWFVVLLWVAAVGFVALRSLWRRSRSLRPVVLSADPTSGEVYGIPALDEAPRPHAALSGELEPPRRW